jgi:hypothetical protein
MKNRIASLIIVVVGFGFEAATAGQGTTPVLFRVPQGQYTDVHRPPCKSSVHFLETMASPEGLAVVGSTLGTGTAAVVFILAKANGEIIEQPGEIAKWYRTLTGQNHASCLSQCVALESGQVPVRLDFTDRRGIEGQYCTSTPNGNHNAFGFYDIPCGDWSEWRHAAVGKLGDGRWAVCAVAANWSHNLDSYHQLLIRWQTQDPPPEYDKMTRRGGPALVRKLVK